MNCKKCDGDIVRRWFNTAQQFCPHCLPVIRRAEVPVPLQLLRTTTQGSDQWSDLACPRCERIFEAFAVLVERSPVSK